jgi:hypothetical protein
MDVDVQPYEPPELTDLGEVTVHPRQRRRRPG